MIASMGRLVSLIILLMLIVFGTPTFATEVSPNNFTIGKYIFIYLGNYRGSDVSTVFNQSLSYTISKFTHSSIGLDISFSKNDIVYINKSYYSDFTISKYLIVASPPSAMIFKSIIIVVDDGSNTSASYLFQLRLIRPCRVPMIFIIFKLSLHRIMDIKHFIQDIILPLMRELVNLDILNPKCSFTRFTNIDPENMDDREKLLLITRYFLLESILLNSSSNSTSIVHDFLYNGVSDYELAYIGAMIGAELGYNPIIIKYVYKNNSYWFTIVDSKIYLSSIDRLFTLQCYGIDNVLREYRILVGTENNLWHWILILGGRVDALRYYGLSNGTITLLNNGICRFSARNYGWLLVQSLEGINRTLIYYCSRESMEVIGPGCLVVNYAYYLFQKEYLYRNLELDFDEIEKYISSRTSDNLLGRNNFLLMIYPWFYYSYSFNKLGTSYNQTIYRNISIDKSGLVITMPAYVYIPLAISTLVIVYLVFLFYYVKIFRKPRFKNVFVEEGIGEVSSIDREAKTSYLGETLKIGVREGIVGIFSHIIDILSKYSWKKPWETHREYGERIKKLFNETIRSLYMRICVLYEKARFSYKEITIKDLEEAWNIYYMINNEVKKMNYSNLEENN